jgi:hypothetical protein
MNNRLYNIGLAPSTTPSAASGGEDILMAAASTNLLIQNNLIQDSVSPITLRNSDISKNVSIRNNIIEGGMTGISITNSSRDINIQGNTIECWSSNSLASTGISITGSGVTSDISNNRIQSCVDGAHVDSTSGKIALSNNHIDLNSTRTTTTGIHLAGNNIRFEVSSNSISNAKIGVNVSTGSGNIHGNYLQRPSGTSNILCGSIPNNSYVGICLDGNSVTSKVGIFSNHFEYSNVLNHYGVHARANMGNQSIEINGNQFRDLHSDRRLSWDVGSLPVNNSNPFISRFWEAEFNGKATFKENVTFEKSITAKTATIQDDLDLKGNFYVAKESHVSFVSDNVQFTGNSPKFFTTLKADRITLGNATAGPTDFGNGGQPIFGCHWAQNRVSSITTSHQDGATGLTLTVTCDGMKASNFHRPQHVVSGGCNTNTGSKLEKSQPRSIVNFASDNKKHDSWHCYWTDRGSTIGKYIEAHAYCCYE